MSAAAAATPELSEKVHNWYAELTIGRATTLVPLDDSAWALLTPEWPLSYANNGILVRRDPGAAQLISWADEVLGGAELNHRYVMAMCDLSIETIDGLAAAGYTMEPELQMVRPLTDADITPAAANVSFVDEETVRPLNERLWREEWLPTATDEAIRQLVGRRETYSRSSRFISFVVRATESPALNVANFAACCDVAVSGWATELDGVTTLGDYRKRGYGDVLVKTALSIARSHGCDYAVLTALADDWPRHWYARRGFLETGPAWVATKLIDDQGPTSTTETSQTATEQSPR